LSLIACTAFAQDLEDGEDGLDAGRTFKMQLLAGLRYGTHNLNLGFGARGGFLLPNHMWLGGAFDYFMGASLPNKYGGIDKYKTWNVGGEVGYEVGLADGFSLSPYLGLGLAHSEDTPCAPLVTGEVCARPMSGNDPVCTLGGLLMYRIGMFSMSGDVRVRSVVANSEFGESAAWISAWVFGAEAGIVF
jgi:hypothetical protein